MHTKPLGILCLLVLATTLPLEAQATKLMCSIHGDRMEPTAIMWDTETNEASVKLFAHEPAYKGHISRVTQKHSFNLVFPDPFPGKDVEFFAALIGEDQWRVSGVMYKREGSERYLEDVLVEAPATCTSM